MCYREKKLNTKKDYNRREKVYIYIERERKTRREQNELKQEESSLLLEHICTLKKNNNHNNKNPKSIVYILF